MSALASARWSGRVDSTNVMARASARRSPERTAAARSAATAGLPVVLAQEVEDRGGGVGDVRPWPEDGDHPSILQHLVVLRGDDAAAHDEDVVAPRGAEGLDELRHERLVAGGLAGDPHHV